MFHTGRRIWQAAIAVFVGCVMAPMGIGQTPELSDTPPARFRTALSEADSPFEATRQAALARLGDHPDWEPFFRAALNAMTDREVRDRLRPALCKCQSPLVAWNLDRAKIWARELRFDYLTALAAATDAPEAASSIGQLILTAQAAVYDKFREIGPWRNGQSPLPEKRTFINKLDYESFARSASFARVSGDRVTLTQDYKPALVHARGGEIAVTRPTFWVCLSDHQLKPSGYVGWQWSVVCVNHDATFHDFSETLIICDGDVEFTRYSGLGTGCTWSVVVANGTVRLGAGFDPTRSLIYAAEDMIGDRRNWNNWVSLLAGGKNQTLPDPTDPDNKKHQQRLGRFFREGVKENPFGVKFVSPADAGIELDVGVKVVRLGKLADDSPLAKAGLQTGDRVLNLNGVRVDTAADFRRQLRESLLWGTGLFEVKRGAQSFQRLVTFGGPPKK